MRRWLDLPAVAMLATLAPSRAQHRPHDGGAGSRRRAPVDAGVRIEYTPHLDGDPDPGEVVWTWVPFEEDPTLGKDRPVVIIGRHGELPVGRRPDVEAASRDTVEVGTGPWDARGGRATPRSTGCSTSTPPRSGARAPCSAAAASTP